MTRKFERYGFWAFSIIVLLTLYAENRGVVIRDYHRPGQVKAYLKQYKYLSTELEQKTGIPATIIIAVAGLESDWGRSELAKNANNHFGIKIKKGWGGMKYCKETEEYAYTLAYKSHECFRKYPLIRDSYEDFGRFITQQVNYKWMLKLHDDDIQGWAEGLQNSGYATDPAYAEKLMRLINKYSLTNL